VKNAFLHGGDLQEEILMVIPRGFGTNRLMERWAQEIFV
jgi:hypothetical protein